MSTGTETGEGSAAESAVGKESLRYLEDVDLPFEMVEGLDGPFDLTDSYWFGVCPECNTKHRVDLGYDYFGQENWHCCPPDDSCDCLWTFPWWNLDTLSVYDDSIVFEDFDRLEDLLGY
jgi:hypothetical protein